MLPFELASGVVLGGLTFTNVEVPALAVIGLWLALLLGEQRFPRVPRVLLVGSVALLLCLAASALQAGTWRGAALKFTARQGAGALLALCVADHLARGGWPVARRLGTTLLAGMALSAAVGLAEISEDRTVLGLLGVFKDQPTMVGGILRLSATFAYANIAAMAYEATLPLALIGVGLASSRLVAAALAGSAALLYTAALLTYSRAAFLTLGVLVVGVGVGALLLARRIDPLFRWRRVLAVCGALLAVTTAMVAWSPAFRVRLFAPDIDSWYRAEYAPGPLGQLAPNQMTTTPITIANRGLVPWQPDTLRPVVLSYHWLDATTRRIVQYDGLRTEQAWHTWISTISAQTPTRSSVWHRCCSMARCRTSAG